MGSFALWTDVLQDSPGLDEEIGLLLVFFFGTVRDASSMTLIKCFSEGEHAAALFFCMRCDFCSAQQNLWVCCWTISLQHVSRTFASKSSWLWCSLGTAMPFRIDCDSVIRLAKASLIWISQHLGRHHITWLFHMADRKLSFFCCTGLLEVFSPADTFSWTCDLIVITRTQLSQGSKVLKYFTQYKHASYKFGMTKYPLVYPNPILHRFNSNPRI